MKDYIWQTTNEVINLKDVCNTSNLVYVYEDVIKHIDKVDLVSFYKEPEKYSKIKLKLKEVTDYITDHDKIGFVVEKGAELLVPLYYIFLSVDHCGNDPELVLVKSVSLENGDFSYVLAPDDVKDKFKKWCEEIKAFVEKKFDWCNDDDITEPYKHVTIDAEIDKTVYIGETIDIEISENMSIENFKNVFQEKFGVIPCIFDHKKEDKNLQHKLSCFGISGKTLVRIPPFFKLGDIDWELRNQLHLSSDIEFRFRYVARPWAFLLGRETLTEVDQLPPVWKSIGFNLLLKLADMID